MRLFISCAPEDARTCARIVKTLSAHEVWHAQQDAPARDSWEERLRRLDWCELVLCLLSVHSVASTRCRREWEIARRLKRDILPILLDSATLLPEKISGGHFIDFSSNLTVENVSQLLNELLLRERELASAPADASGGSITAPAQSPAEIVSHAVLALENGDYALAAHQLKLAQANGYQSRFLRLEALLKAAETAAAERPGSETLQRAYQHLVALFRFETMRQMACEELADFRRKYGEHDPQNLRRYCKEGTPADAPPLQKQQAVPAPPRIAPGARESAISQRAADKGINAVRAQSQRLPAPAASARRNRLQLDDDSPAKAREALPMLQWRDIPHGTVTIASVVGSDEDFGELTEQVDNFVISAYPVTNAQFAIFIQAQDGYRNPRWWQFSPHAQRWFQQGNGAGSSRFSGDSHPRETVNWYEAMAFANWLGAQLQMKLSLPTIAQWQRAAKGDDDRYYPWGDGYHEERCNTVEAGIRATTPVDRYRKGVSPYGVYDLAGNVWEWTTNTAAAAEAGKDYRRAVVGGSYVSPCDRAQTSYRHYLDPHVRYSSIGIRLVGLP